MDGILSGLNPAQLKAVTHDPKIPLQILAGPGSGKTKVLTSRIVQLILSHSLPPQSICAVTFTNKAANEMRERLKKLLGPDITSQIRMGTFHSLCVMFLRRYAKLVGLNGDFTICDSDDSKKVMIKLLKNHKPVLQGKGIALKEEAVLSFISKAKAKGLSPNDIKSHLLAEANAKKPNKMGKQSMISFIDEVQIELYREYEDALMTNNCLDFDDLLVFGVRLFQYHPKVRTWCKHILVDEFQDTNTMQYNLMQYIASAKDA
ncbi:hypothetical protein QCA50_007771 [Cerrena zonata]|uniref:UvrD-like helicase ATP-binding domain-containing protein n=1 Tax=Cerrena zonata TaxID=2478898 RepID=A0AAW0GJ88_9APHY